VFVGRITRRKPSRTCSTPRPTSTPTAQLVLCAGARHPGARRRIAQKVERLHAERGNVVWIEQMLAKQEVIQLLSHATVFVCPSIYEPARLRQPGSDGLRGRGRRDENRGIPRSSRRV